MEAHNGVAASNSRSTSHPPSTSIVFPKPLRDLTGASLQSCDTRLQQTVSRASMRHDWPCTPETSYRTRSPGVAPHAASATEFCKALLSFGTSKPRTIDAVSDDPESDGPGEVASSFASVALLHSLSSSGYAFHFDNVSYTADGGHGTMRRIVTLRTVVVVACRSILRARALNARRSSVTAGRRIL